MSKDNYLNFDKHELQIHVYRIRKSLKGLSKAEKFEMLSKEHFVIHLEIYFTRLRFTAV